MRDGDWPKALALAAAFSRLGHHAAAIRRAHEATWNPTFFKQLGRDPDELVEAGIAALRERYARALACRPQK